MNLLEGLIPTKDPGVLAGSKRLERLFVFCLMWSLGALLELEDRDKLEAYIRAHESSIDVPQIQSGETMFEYMVNPNGTLIYTIKYRQCVFVNRAHMTNCMAPSVQVSGVIGITMLGSTSIRLTSCQTMPLSLCQMWTIQEPHSCWRLLPSNAK